MFKTLNQGSTAAMDQIMTSIRVSQKIFYPNPAGTQKSWPKLRSVGPNFPMDMSLKRLTR